MLRPTSDDSVTHVGTPEIQGVTNSQAPPAHLQDLFDRGGLTDQQEEQFKQLLVKHQHLFGKSPDYLCRISVIKYSIDTADAAPIKQAPRRPPRAFTDQEEEIIQKQLKAGIVEVSNSPWSSPLVYVRKRNGTTWPCVVFRSVDAVSRKDAYPLPGIDDCLGGSKLFTVWDIQSGYWQVGVDEADRPKAVFATRSGLYLYVTIPFDFTGAPSTFQRCMELVLGGL